MSTFVEQRRFTRLEDRVARIERELKLPPIENEHVSTSPSPRCLSASEDPDPRATSVVTEPSTDATKQVQPPPLPTLPAFLF